MKAIGPNARRDLVRSVQALHQEGVVHTDIRRANLLWSRETGRLMVIDFERAILLPSRRRALAQVIPNKRARTSGQEGCKAGLQIGSEAERQRHYDLESAKALLPI